MCGCVWVCVCCNGADDCGRLRMIADAMIQSIVWGILGSSSLAYTPIPRPGVICHVHHWQASGFLRDKEIIQRLRRESVFFFQPLPAWASSKNECTMQMGSTAGTFHWVLVCGLKYARRALMQWATCCLMFHVVPFLPDKSHAATTHCFFSQHLPHSVYTCM